jgi:predicted ATPase
VLYGLATLHEYRGEYSASQLLIERRLELPPDPGDSAAVVASHELLACSLFHQGAFAQALAHAEAGLRAHRADDRHPAASALEEHPMVNCHGWAGLALWFLEQPEVALDRARAGVDLAREPDRHYSLANALVALARVHQHRDEPAAVRATAEEAFALANAKGFPYVAAAAGVLAGWAMTSLGEHDDGLRALRAALAAHEATGARMDRPDFLGLLAEASLAARRDEDAADALRHALALLVPGRRFFYENALHRLEALLQRQRVP